MIKDFFHLLKREAVVFLIPNLTFNIKLSHISHYVMLMVLNCYQKLVGGDSTLCVPWLNGAGLCHDKWWNNLIYTTREDNIYSIIN